MQNGMTYIVRPRMQPRYSSVMTPLHLGRGHPVVGRAGVGLVDRADEGALLDPGHVGRVGAGPERVRLLLRVEAHQRAGGDQLVGEPVPLRVGAVAPDDPVGRGELGDLAHPGEQCGVAGGGVVEPGMVAGAVIGELPLWSALTRNSR